MFTQKNAYWNALVSPVSTIFQYSKELGGELHNYQSRIAAYKTLGMALLEKRDYKLVQGLLTLKNDYDQYKKMQEENSPRWLDSNELPAVREMFGLTETIKILDSKIKIAQEKCERYTKRQQQLEQNLKNLKQNLASLGDNENKANLEKNIRKVEKLVSVTHRVISEESDNIIRFNADKSLKAERLSYAQQLASEQIKELDRLTKQIAKVLELEILGLKLATLNEQLETFFKKYPQPKNELDDNILRKKFENLLSTDILEQKNHQLYMKHIDIDKIIFIVRSRLSILAVDAQLEKENRKETLAVVVPVHKEFNRLKDVSQCVTGENFLQKKCEDLLWLFSGCNNITGKIYFVDDQAPHGKDTDVINENNQSKTRSCLDKKGIIRPCIYRSIDAIDDLLQTPNYSQYRGLVECLGYENLQAEIQLFSDENLRKMHVNDLANKSVKAGAIYLGLRYVSGAADGIKKATKVIYIDADLSIEPHVSFGEMLYELIHNPQTSCVVGSRRTTGNPENNAPHSVVGNKSAKRHTWSFWYNFLNRSIVNVQVPDNLVGCKGFNVEAITQISPGMHNLSLSFDVELYRLLKDSELNVKSISTDWVDSPWESQTNSLAAHAFAGSIDIAQRTHDFNSSILLEKMFAALSTNKTFEQLHTELINDKKIRHALLDILKLAMDPTFTFILNHAMSVLDGFVPFVYRSLINNLKLFFEKLSNGEIDRKIIIQLFTDFHNILKDTTQSHALGFMVEKFPEIFSLLEIFVRNPVYFRVLAPVFLGSNALAEMLARKPGLPPLNEFKEKKSTHMEDEIKSVMKELKMSTSETKEHEKLPITTKKQNDAKEAQVDLLAVFKKWGEQQIETQKKKTSGPKKEIFRNIKREAEGWNTLKENLAEAKKKPICINLVMQFDQNGRCDGSNHISAEQYAIWKNIIANKIIDLEHEMSKYCDKSQIQVKLLIVDARSESSIKQEKKDDSKKAIISIIDECTAGNNFVSAEYYKLPQELSGKGKAVAIRQGMRFALQTNNPDAVGFVDFSTKIPIQEIGIFFAAAIGSNEEKPVVAIGTRRAPEAEVLGKRMAYLLRSTASKYITQSFLPELAHISDTNTGFKVYPAQIMNKILQDSDLNAELNANSFAFDAELLMRCVALCQVKEFCVVFNDNTEEINSPDLLGPSDDILKDILQISSREKRRTRRFQLQEMFDYPDEAKPVFLGSGAEHLVYAISPNKVLKIGSQHVVPLFKLILQQIILNQSSGEKDTKETVDGSLFLVRFEKILKHPKFQRFIPLLRNNPEINRLVLGAIAAWENKMKSFDLHEVLKRGRDLVGPFSFVDLPFGIELEGENYTINPEFQAKICVKTEEILEEKFLKILKDNLILCKKAPERRSEVIDMTINLLIENVIKPAINLFNRMWRRGLFDLDTNIISDLGFFINSEGSLSLMSLDPGEMITGIMNVDVNRALMMLEKRTDILLMKSHIDEVITNLGLPIELAQQIQIEVIGYYENQMKLFFEKIKKEQMILNANSELGLEMTSALTDVTYEKDWRESRNKSEFHIEEVTHDFSPPQQSKQKVINANQYSIMLNTRYLTPHRSDVLPPFTEQKVTNTLVLRHSPYLIVSSGNEDLVASHLQKAIEEETIILGMERGSIVPLIDLFNTLDKHDEEFHAELQNTSNVNTVFVLDAGKGSRTGLIGSAAKTKGSIQFAGETLNDYALKTSSLLSEELENLGVSNCIILASCDDRIESKDVPNLAGHIQQYFHGSDSPGIYWFDLPDAGKNYTPFTVSDTYRFLTSPAMKQEVKQILNHILMTRGYVKQGVVDEGFNILDQIYDHVCNLMNSELTSERPPIAPSGLPEAMINFLQATPIIPELMTRYAKLMQMNMLIEGQISGFKRPFLMVMKKEFMLDFRKIVDRHHDALDKVKNEITWENLILRAFKADEFMWNLFKPSNMDSQIWQEIRKDLLNLGKKHHVDISNGSKQNNFRAFTVRWHNLDDPLAIFSTALETFGQTSEAKQSQNIRLVSDMKIENIELNYCNEGLLTVVALGSTLSEAHIFPSLQQQMRPVQYNENILFYNLRLEQGTQFYPTLGHVHVQINGIIYSTSLGPHTKDELKKQAIYQYVPDEQGRLKASLLNTNLDKFSEYCEKLVNEEKTTELATSPYTYNLSKLFLPANDNSTPVAPVNNPVPQGEASGLNEGHQVRVVSPMDNNKLGKNGGV